MNMPNEIRDFIASVDALVAFVEHQLEAGEVPDSTAVVIREDLGRQRRTREALFDYLRTSEQ